MGAFDDAIEFLKMATDGASALQDANFAHEKAMANTNAAQDTLLLSQQIQGVNDEMKYKKTKLNQTLRDQYVRYKGYKKDLNDLGAVVKGYETLSDEDITSAGLNFIDTTSADLKERMFNRNMEQYDKYCDDYEENQDTETLANIEKYEDRLKYFIKK